MAGFNQGAGNIATAIARGPLYRRQAMEQAARNAELGAREGYYRAQTDETDAKTAELVRKGALVEALQRTAPLAEKAYAEGRFDDPALNEYLGATSALTGMDKGDLAKNMKQNLGTRFALQGKTSLAGAVENPTSTANNAADNASREKMDRERGTVLSPGAALVRDDKIVLLNPSAAAQVEQFDTVTEEYPEKPEVAGTPAQVKSHWFGPDTVIPAVPGQPAQPARKVTRKIPRGGSLTDALANVPAGGTTNAPAEAPAAKEVQRKTKDGRIAIFNAETKEFLRYAN